MELYQTKSTQDKSDIELIQKLIQEKEKIRLSILESKKIKVLPDELNCVWPQLLF